MPKSIDFACLFSQANWYFADQGPKYQQLYRYIANLIINNELAPTTQLPSEREFAKMTSVSRVTLRQSINLLTQEGLIKQRRGAGSFVLPNGSLSVARFDQLKIETLRFDRDHETSILLNEIQRLPTSDETVALGIKAWNKIVQFDYLCQKDDDAFGYEITIVPEQLVALNSIQSQCVYHRLTENGYGASRVLQNITADLAHGEIAHFLKLPVGNPLLHLKQTAYLETGRPVEFTRGYYRTDKFSLLSELKVPKVTLAAK